MYVEQTVEANIPQGCGSPGSRVASSADMVFVKGKEVGMTVGVAKLSLLGGAASAMRAGSAKSAAVTATSEAMYRNCLLRSQKANNECR